MANPVRQFFSTRSVRVLLRAVFGFIICCYVVFSAVCLLYTYRLIRVYDRQISNIEFANTLSRVPTDVVARQSWLIVAGRQTFDDSGIYAEIDAMQRDLQALRDNTAPNGGRELVEAAMRAGDTLTVYVDRLRDQWEAGVPLSYQQTTLDEINNVSGSIYDVLQEFTYAQITSIADANEEMQRTTLLILGLLAVLSLAVSLIAFAAYRMLREAVDRANVEIAALAERVRQGDLETRVPSPGLEELNKLADGINLMARRIQTLVDNSIEEQKKLQKSELRALQAQITPHFIYNTFETIVWLAECGHNKEVVEVTIAFTNYYRTALSSGRDFITVGQEVQHVRDYLTIQRFRYEDILRYEIDMDPAMKERPMLKLLLQPLVENALYHGIKNRRGGGTITVRCRRDGGGLRFAVEDDGIGMKPWELDRLRKAVAADHLPEHFGYGLYNVNRRIRIYYGAADLLIESTHGKGTRISFALSDKEEL